MEPTPVGRSRQYRTPVRRQQPAHRRPNGRRAVPSPVRRVLDALRDAERATRPEDPEVAAAHAARWEELPAGVRTASQLLGRRFTGCEGTHGVFPACNLGCEPCYHGKDANRVPVDGVHTVAKVERQMAYLRERRGPGQYAQLIGGEVSLLPPDAHAEALATMRRHGRIPMSFTHGDFDQDYLEAVVLAPDGTPRFDAVAFAVHIDSTMRGRRAAKQPRNEAELHDERARVAAMFEQLQQRYGIRSYLAHNMTVTPDNVDEIPEVVQVCRELGYRMCSFQPAAYVGDQRRWDEGYRELTDELVWSRIEAGVGRRLPFRALQVGDERCNRSTWGVWVGGGYTPLFDDRDRRDLPARDAGALAWWIARFLGRMATRATTAGLRGRRQILATTYVMHRFMDAHDVHRAWELLERGVAADDPTLRATQERLRACAYGMAHPESDRIVPACVQHSVLDPAENQQLIQLLPPRSRKNAG